MDRCRGRFQPLAFQTQHLKQGCVALAPPVECEGTFRYARVQGNGKLPPTLAEPVPHNHS